MQHGEREQVLEDDRTQRIRAEELLRCVSGVGRARKIMASIGIAPNRRVRGLGYWQRDFLPDAVVSVRRAKEPSGK